MELKVSVAKEEAGEALPASPEHFEADDHCRGRLWS